MDTLNAVEERLRWADTLDEIAHQFEGLDDWQAALDGAASVLRESVGEASWWRRFVDGLGLPFGWFPGLRVG